MMHTIGLHHVFAPIALSVYPICIMCFMKTRELLLLLALTATTGMQAQRIKGSDTVLPIAQQTAERFMTLNPSARVTVTGGGTGVGISALLDQTTDIAMASRAIKFSEKMKAKAAGEDLAEVPIAYDALAVVVHPSNPVKQLTRQQLEDIFRGKVTNWQQVGGDDRKIVVYSRETSSGTYEFFKESVLKNKNYMSSSLHACHGSHYPIRQPNSRSHRICGSSLCITAYQDTRRFIRRAALCRSHAGECHQ